MSECTGADLLVELCCHLRFNDLLPAILETTKCIPCMMPFITSQFMPRTKGDRPAVRPVGTTNLASIGQFCEIPDHVGFTVEYAVRSRKRQSMPMFGFDKEVSPIYKGTHDLGVLLGSALAMVH